MNGRLNTPRGTPPVLSETEQILNETPNIDLAKIDDNATLVILKAIRTHESGNSDLQIKINSIIAKYEKNPKEALTPDEATLVQTMLTELVEKKNLLTGQNIVPIFASVFGMAGQTTMNGLSTLQNSILIRRNGKVLTQTEKILDEVKEIDLDDIDEDSTLLIVKAIRNNESSSPDLLAKLTTIIAKYEKNPKEALDTDEAALVRVMIKELIDHKAILVRKAPGGVESMFNSAFGGIRQLTVNGLQKVNGAPPAAQALTLALMGLFAWWAVGKKSVKGLLTVAAGGLAASFLSKHLTGKSISQWADRAIDSPAYRKQKKSLITFFGLNETNESHSAQIDALYSSIKQETNFGSNSFSTIIAGCVNDPAGRFTNRTLLHNSGLNLPKKDSDKTVNSFVRLIVLKYGPDSSLYKNDPKVKQAYDKIMSDPNITWRQGVMDLLKIDRSFAPLT